MVTIAKGNHFDFGIRRIQEMKNGKSLFFTTPKHYARKLGLTKKDLRT
ncbi:MAG: hypothetical protein M3297_14830 [Thermoproteota archaeon]|nr:hypothetical protein [Thermoproteota archaeon]